MPSIIRPRPASRARSGFSLVELLVVLSLIVLLLALVLPAVNNITGGFEVTNAADTVVAQFEQARQIAMARNRNVELRLYSYKGEIGNDKRYYAMQSFIAADDSASSWKALGRLQKLPSRLAFDSGATLSPLIGTQAAKPGSGAGIKLPGAGSDYQYATVTFRPDGSASIPQADPPADPATPASTGLFLTIKASRLPDPGTALPKNYAIVQVFPVTGLIRSYRP